MRALLPAAGDRAGGGWAHPDEGRTADAGRLSGQRRLGHRSVDGRLCVCTAERGDRVGPGPGESVRGRVRTLHVRRRGIQDEPRRRSLADHAEQLYPRVAVRQDGDWALDFRSFTPRIRLSGPLVANRLFLAQSAHYRYVHTPLTALPGEPTVGLRSFDSYTRLDTAAMGRHQFTMALALFPRTLRHAGLNTFNPYEVTTTVQQRGHNAGFAHRWAGTAATLVEFDGERESV